MKYIFKIFGACCTLLLGIIAIANADFKLDPLQYVSGYHVVGTETGSDTTGDSRLIDTIKNAINRVLGMLSLIALVLCIRGGFQMLIANGDESKVKTGTKVLKHAAIGLAVIGLSWLFVTFIFYLINNSAETA